MFIAKTQHFIEDLKLKGVFYMFKYLWNHKYGALAAFGAGVLSGLSGLLLKAEDSKIRETLHTVATGEVIDTDFGSTAETGTNDQEA